MEQVQSGAPMTECTKEVYGVGKRGEPFGGVFTPEVQAWGDGLPPRRVGGMSTR